MTEGHKLARRASGIRTAQQGCTDIFRTPAVSAFANAKAAGVTLPKYRIVKANYYKYSGLPRRLQRLALAKSRRASFIAAFFLITIVSFSSFAQSEDKFLDIHEVTSPGGITAWLVNDESVPVISMEFAFKGAGAALDPPEKQGLVRLLSNTMDEGAGELDSHTFQSALREHSIDLHFNSSRDAFYGSIKTLKENKDKAFELMNLALTKPRFDPDPVERMRQANISRIKSSLSDPKWLAARLMNDVAFSGHPYAKNSGGTLSTLRNIEPEDLKNFASKQLGKDRLLVSVTGDITGEELAPVLDRIFGALPETAPPAELKPTEIRGGGEIVLYEHDIPQTVIEIMQPGISRKNPDYYKAVVMNFILGSSGFGSRLMEELREKRGLTYGVYTGLYNLDYAKTLTLSTSTENSNAGEILKIIRQEWKKIQNEPVSKEELHTAKSYLIGSMPLMLSSTDKISSLTLSLQLDDLPIDFLDKREDIIRSVSREEVMDIAKKLLVSDELTVIMVGKPKGIEPTRTVESLPNVE
jgi:zinc protease